MKKKATPEYDEKYKEQIRLIADKNQKEIPLTPEEKTILKLYFAGLRMKYGY
jgi:hypothetical protein